VWGDPLLGPGDDPRLNACINYGLDQWYVYATGYRASAEIILDRVRKASGGGDGWRIASLFVGLSALMAVFYFPSRTITGPGLFY
jgi:hypothetical protein